MKKYQLIRFKPFEKTDEDFGIVVFTYWREKFNLIRWIFGYNRSYSVEFFCTKDGKQWKIYLDGSFVSESFNHELSKAFEPFKNQYIEYLIPKIHYSWELQ